MRSCEECKYLHVNEHAQAHSSMPYEFIRNECHRYPPVNRVYTVSRHFTGSAFEFPSVSELDWCGEFVHK